MDDLTAGLGSPSDYGVYDGRAARSIVQSLLSDLDRKFQLPPVVFCSELARDIVSALLADPQKLAPLVRQVSLACRGMAVVERLARQGVRVRLAAGILRAGPKQSLSPGIVETIKRHKAAIVAALEGG